MENPVGGCKCSSHEGSQSGCPNGVRARHRQSVLPAGAYSPIRPRAAAYSLAESRIEKGSHSERKNLHILGPSRAVRASTIKHWMLLDLHRTSRWVSSMRFLSR